MPSHPAATDEQNRVDFDVLDGESKLRVLMSGWMRGRDDREVRTTHRARRASRSQSRQQA
jgi:hypothetical protein